MHSVSYTHLDVYKRQEKVSNHEQNHCDRGGCIARDDVRERQGGVIGELLLESVSYTHLDVYKRQFWNGSRSCNRGVTRPLRSISRF